MSSPYASQPLYADVNYIDGKIRVARNILKNHTDLSVLNRWTRTLDLLLEQRTMLQELEHGNYRSTSP